MKHGNIASPFASVSRRGFLLTGGAAVAVATFGPVTSLAADKPAAQPSKPLVGSQIYGWGQYYQREGRDLNAHLGDVMSALRDAGYDYLESNVDVGTPENNARFAEQLRAKGLQPVCLYTGARLHDEKAGEVVLLHVGTFGRYGYPGIRPPAIRVTILALKAADHLLIGETCLCIQVHVGNEVILVPGTVRHDIDLVHAVL